MIKKSGLIAILLTFVFTMVNITATAYFEDADGIKHYGWNVIATEDNKQCFEFDEDGNVSNVWAADGDVANQRVNMYALRELAIGADEEYTIEATFTPDSETDLSVERAYGLVAWYLDGDNYLIYWMQQKTDGGWSGQFYGRVDGTFRRYVTDLQLEGKTPSGQPENYWHSGEYNDMWWDNPNTAHPDVLGERSVLCDMTFTLQVVSKIETLTVNEQEHTVRSFELHQIIDGVDFIPSVYYVDNVREQGDGFTTGIYAEAFNFAVSDFALTNETDYAAAVTAEIENLGSVASEEDIYDVMMVRSQYEGLLALKSEVAPATVEALAAAEQDAAAYIDDLIMALDNTKSTFVEDVDTVYDLYGLMSDEIISYITKTAELAEAVNDAKDWEDPNIDPDPEDEGEEEEKKGCFGNIATTLCLLPVLFIGGGLVIKKRKRLN